MGSPVAMSLVLGEIPASAQWTNPPPGASMSIISRASSPVPAGRPDHRSGSETLLGHAYCFGIVPPAANAGLETLIVAGAAGVAAVVIACFAPQPATASTAPRSAVRLTRAR